MDKEKSEHLSQGVILRTHKSGKQTIAVRFTYKGIRCTEALKVSPNSNGKKYAERLRGEILNAIERQKFNYQEYFPDSKKAAMFGYSVTNELVSEAIDLWLADIKKAHRPSTYNTYRKRSIRIKSKIGHLRKRDVSGSVVRNLVRGMDGLALKTIRNNLIPLRAVMDQSVIDREIQFNPTDGLKLAKLVTRKPKTDPVDPFEYDELLAIIRKAGELYGPAYQNFVAFSFYQGPRTSETFGLKWPDIDWRASTVSISRGIVDRELQEETKTTAGKRKLDLTVGGYRALKAQQEITGFKGQFVFCRPNGKDLDDYEQTSIPWNRVLKALGIRWRTQYQTRHTWASHKLSYSENLFYIAKQMGHKDAEMLLKVYGKWIESAKGKEQMPEEFTICGPAADPLKLTQKDSGKLGR